MLYKVARTFLASVKWVWIGLFIALLINFTANLLVVKRGDFSDTFAAALLTFFLTPGLLRTTLFLAVACIVLLTVSARIIVAGEKRSLVDKSIQDYLQKVIEMNQALRPRGFAQKSQALFYEDVPLNDIFVHLNMVADRPIYDIPLEQQKLLEEIRQRSDLSAEEREERIQRLHVIWYSQAERERAAKRLRSRRGVSVDEMIRQRSAANPVAILLGAPGSGKSTVLCWFALQAAQLMLIPGYHLRGGPASPDDDDVYDNTVSRQEEENLRRIPILVRINDYSKVLSVDERLSFEQFLVNHIEKEYAHIAGLSSNLLSELAKGHCLMLLDGLDEVASDDLRRRIAQAIQRFLRDYTKNQRDAKEWNIFFITSRIIGYESQGFTNYAHYTLLDLEQRQIQQFLSKWCPTYERQRAMAVQEMKPLSPQQERQAKEDGWKQRSLLLDAFANSPSIARLAGNPLMLTILALIQRSGKALPHSRIELYQVVTTTLLVSWNQGSGRRVFPTDEIELAEQLLGELAYQLHSKDPLLTEQEVKGIARRTMADFYDHDEEQIKDADIAQFIETLRYSSGLFAESGQGLFNFMHRTFQEYFVARYLLRKTAEEFQQFAVTHYQAVIWHEPLLLAIAYKSRLLDDQKRQEVSEVLQAILQAGDDYDRVLNTSLLFAASSIVDCNSWSIKVLQGEIANSLFDLYGEMFARGRYLRLRREIEEVMLLWLRGQPPEITQKGIMPPLLTAWSEALQNENLALRQEGAVRLFAQLTPRLAGCPDPVLSTLLPLLFKLARVEDFADLSALETLVEISPRIEYYAWQALDSLREPSMHDWLLGIFAEWGTRNQDLLPILGEHAETLAIPLLPSTRTILDPLGFYLLSRLVEREAREAAKMQAWQDVWDGHLREEMARGRWATYQHCLSLRLLLYEDNQQLQRALADELLEALANRHQQQRQVLLLIIAIYLNRFEQLVQGSNETMDASLPAPISEDLSDADSEYLDLNDLSPPSSRYRQRGHAWQRTRPTRRRSSGDLITGPLLPGPVSTGWPTRMKRFWEFLFQELPKRVVEKLLDWFSHPSKEANDFPLEYDTTDWDDELPPLDDGAPVQPSLTLPRRRKVWQTALALQGMEEWLSELARPHMLTDDEIDELLSLLDREKITAILCTLLKKPVAIMAASEMLALHVTLATYESIPATLKTQLQASIDCCEEQLQPLTLEHRLLLNAIRRWLKDAGEGYESADTRALALTALKKFQQLDRVHVERILVACSDIRRTTRMYGRPGNRLDCINEIAWVLLTRQFDLTVEAQKFVMQALDDEQAIVCATAARLLQNCRVIAQETRQEATQSILRILADPGLSRRPLEAPDKRDWRLDDILFDTLQALAERGR